MAEGIFKNVVFFFCFGTVKYELNLQQCGKKKQKTERKKEYIFRKMCQKEIVSRISILQYLQ